MARYEIRWSAFGTAEVRADSEEDALELVHQGIYDLDPMEWMGVGVDGIDLEVDAVIEDE